MKPAYGRRWTTSPRLPSKVSQVARRTTRKVTNQVQRPAEDAPSTAYPPRPHCGGAGAGKPPPTRTKRPRGGAPFFFVGKKQTPAPAPPPPPGPSPPTEGAQN